MITMITIIETEKLLNILKKNKRINKDYKYQLKRFPKSGWTYLIALEKYATLDFSVKPRRKLDYEYFVYHFKVYIFNASVIYGKYEKVDYYITVNKKDILNLS